MRGLQIYIHFLCQIVLLAYLQQVKADNFPDCPTIQQYDVIKGQVNLIKYISGTSFYAVVDSKNNFILNDVDSADIKATYQGFSDSKNQSPQSTDITNSIVSSEGTKIYVMTSSSLSLRDLSTMQDVSIPLKWIESFEGASLKILKIDTLTSRLYFGAEYAPKGSAPSVIVAFVSLIQNSQPMFGQIAISTQPDPLKPDAIPSAVSVLAFTLNVAIDTSTYHVIVGYSSTSFNFGFIDTKSPTKPSSFWDLTQSFPPQTSQILATYFKEDENKVYFAFGGTKQGIYSYDLKLFKKTGQTWNTIEPATVSDKITNVNLITYFDSKFYIVVKDGQNYVILYGTEAQIKAETYTKSTSFTNKITAIEYITGTSNIIIGTSIGEIFHYNIKTNSQVLKKIPSEIDQYSSVITDSSNQLVMLGTQKLKIFNISTYSSSTTSIVFDQNLEIKATAMYDYSRFARVVRSSLTIQVEIQILNGGVFKSIKYSYLVLTTPQDPVVLSIVFLSSTTLAVGHILKDKSELSVLTYATNPPPNGELQKSVTVSLTLTGQSISMISDSNNNIIINSGETMYCYQYSSSQKKLTSMTLTTKQNDQDNSKTKSIFFFSSYLAAFQTLGPKTALSIFSYDSTSLTTTFIASMDSNSQASDIRISSDYKILVLYSQAKYVFLKFDSTAKKLTQIFSTQTLGAKTGLDYFILSTNELLIVQTNGIIKFALGTDCISQVCTTCKIDTYYNIPISQSSSYLSDSNGSGTSSSQFNTQNKFFSKYYEIINIFSSISNFSEITITNYIQLGSRFDHQQYFFDIYSVYSNGLLGTADLNTQFASPILQFIGKDSTGSSTSTKFSYFFSSTISFPDSLNYVLFQKTDFALSKALSSTMIQSKVKELIFDNVGFSSNDSNNKVTNQSIELLEGDKFTFKNSILSNLKVQKVSQFLKIQASLTITLDTLQFDQCTFEDSSFINGKNTFVTIKGVSFNQCKILGLDRILVFMNFVSLTAETFTLSNNEINNTLLFQNSEYDQPNDPNPVSQDITINNLQMYTNKISVKEFSLSFGFSIEFSKQQQQSVFKISNSQIKSNNLIVLKDNPGNGDNVDTETLSAISQNYFIRIQQQQSLVFNKVDYIDNGSSGFIYGQGSRNIELNTVTCSQTSTSLSQSQSSFLNLEDHTSLILLIQSCVFQNIYLINTYLIKVTTSSFTQVGKDKNDCKITINDTKFINIKVEQTSSFITSSIIFYSTLQKDMINLDLVTFSKINLKSTEKIFDPLGSALTIKAPFSSLEQNKCTFENFKTNGPKGPQELNMKSVKIIDSTFINSNYEELTFTQEGGFGKITTPDLTIKGSHFNNANALYGGALIIIPTTANSKFNFENNTFRMLVSQKEGGAIFIDQSTSKSVFTFSGCSFEYIFTYLKGGCINLEYILPKLDSSSIDFTQSPQLILKKNPINNIFSPQGGILNVANSVVIIEDMTVTQVDSNNYKTTQDQIDLTNIFKSFIQIGPLFFLQQTDLSLKSSNFSGLKVQLLDKIVQKAQFIQATEYTKLKMNVITIKNVQFFDSGFIQVIQTKFYSTDLTISDATYTVQKSSGRILKDITDDVEKSISLINIQKESYIEGTDLKISSVTCSSTKCIGGAIFIQKSNGKITGSKFKTNTASIGGGIAIYNPNAGISIIDSTFDGNISVNEGGGLFFQLVKASNSLNISKSKFLNNSSGQGGGLFLEYIDETSKTVNKSFTSITDSIIKNNYSELFGGGLAYEGQYPVIQSTDIVDNKSKSKFGNDQFSYPSKLDWNKELTNGNQVSKLEITSYYDKDKQMTVHVLPNQQSGKVVLPLIYNLMDDQNLIVDSTYTSQLPMSVQAIVSVDTSLSGHIFLNPLTNTYTFTNDYFNFTNIEISGTPGSKVRLQIESNAIVPVGVQSTKYYLALEFDLFDCKQGEVFQEFQVKTTTTTETFYLCDSCDAGEYSVVYPDKDDKTQACKKCSSHAECPGGNVINVNSEYWRLNDQDDIIVYCENAPSNCLGGQGNSTCSEGHIGPLCESCDIANGYTRAGSFQCAECGDVLINSLKVIGLMTFYVISAKMSVNGILGKIQEAWQQNNPEDAQKLETNASIILKLFLNYIQIFMVMTTFNISIPKTFDSGVQSISSPTVQVLYSFECFFYEIQLKTGVNIIYIGLIFDIILPIICCILFFLTGFITYRNNTFFRSFYIYTSLFYCLMYFQPNIFKDAISLASCRDIGSKKYIRYNVFYECGTEEHNHWSQRLVVPIIVILVVVIPALLCWRIKVNQKTKLGVRKFSFMTSEYVQKAYFWEFVKMNLKLLIMIGLTFLELDIPNKIMFVLFLVVLYGVLLTLYQPYKEELYNKIDTYSIGVLVISIYFGFVAFYNTNVFWIWLIAIILILIINVAFVVWCIQKLILAYLPLLKTKKEGIFNSLLAIKFFRKYFKKEKRVRYLYLMWMKSLIAELKKMGIYNPLSLLPMKNKFSYKMIEQAIREKNNKCEIQIVCEKELESSPCDDQDVNNSKVDGGKQYFKIQIHYINIFLQSQANSPFQKSQITNLPLHEKDVILDDM